MKPDWDGALWIIAATALIMLGVVVPAKAELVPPDPWEVIHAARAHGQADVGRDAMKDPEITGLAAGQPYRIGFYGCHLGRDCTSLLFQARFQIPKAKAKLLAAWNTQKLFGRAWLDDNGHAVLDHPVAMNGGLPKETLAATFSAWQKAVMEFRDYLEISAD